MASRIPQGPLKRGFEDRFDASGSLLRGLQECQDIYVISELMETAWHSEIDHGRPGSEQNAAEACEITRQRSPVNQDVRHLGRDASVGPFGL